MSTLSISELQRIHVEMCDAWSCGEWMSDDIPPWNPMWSDFLTEVPYRFAEPLYTLLNPRGVLPPFGEIMDIPLTSEDIKKVKREIDLRDVNQPEDEEFVGESTGLDNTPSSRGESYGDRGISYNEFTDNQLNDSPVHIHNLEPRALFQDDDDQIMRQRRMECCRRGLSIIEESMESGVAINEGQYIEIASIFKQLSN